ncbi:MAG: YggS family pyridoxal phosphate enzyme, partial [Acidimicrobiia bacterium]
RAGRDPAAVTLVAATKTVSVAQVRAVVAAGVPDVGENRAQELIAKAAELAQPPGVEAAELAQPPGVEAAELAQPPGVRWHFLGRLQRNKVRALSPWVTCWESVDRESLGVEIARRAPGAHVLVEVNLGEEPQKGGCAPSEVPGLVEALVGAELAVDGLMAVPPREGEPRRWFAALRDLGSRLGLTELSMGMTDDFEVAVEEGATIVRVGRALFGPRG